MRYPHAALVVGGQQVASTQALRRLHSNLQAITPTQGLHVGRGDLTQSEHTALKDLLLSKGVPAEKTEERIKDICKKVSAGEVVKALRATNPWQQLKPIASKPGNMLRLVHPEELQQKIREKAAESFGAVPQGGRKKRRQAAQGKGAPALYVEPKALGLVEGSFTAADGQAMHQLKFEDVTADSHGLAFCTCVQAAPFLEGEVLSTDPLCLVTTNALPQDIKTSLDHKVVRYPAHYQPTGESMLLTGSLINLGDEKVELAQGSIAEPTALSTGVCKVCVFRDEFEGDWDGFCKGPVKWLLSAVPAFKVCSGFECGIDCPHFHPSIEEKIDQMVMDLWNRQFQTLEGKKAEPKNSAVFSVLIRVPRSRGSMWNRAQTQEWT